jgi:hypothetical protein
MFSNQAHEIDSDLLPQNSRDCAVIGAHPILKVLAPLRRGSLFLTGRRGALASGPDHPMEGIRVMVKNWREAR